MKLSLLLISFAASVLGVASAQKISIPLTGLCNTGLTTASPQPTGCAASALVTPVNPETGGASVDGNWQLATPYPSAPHFNSQGPNPCSLPGFGPAWVDAPGYAGWLNPDDGLSQWISPLNDVYSPAGWYIYRTAFPIPPGGRTYVLNVEGRVLADDYATAIFLENPAGDSLKCKLAAIPAPLTWTTWSPFVVGTTVTPGSNAYLYFLVYNHSNGEPNPTGLRVEFTKAYVTPE